jgi:hypothetical protein
MRTSHLVMFCSSKLIFIPTGVSAVHSPYSYSSQSLLVVVAANTCLHNALLGTGAHCGGCFFVLFKSVEGKVMC